MYDSERAYYLRDIFNLLFSNFQFRLILSQLLCSNYHFLSYACCPNFQSSFDVILSLFSFFILSLTNDGEGPGS